MSDQPPLYHYTCEHSLAGLQRDGLVLPGVDLAGHPDQAKPARDLPWPAMFSWFTDLATMRGDLEKWAVVLHPENQELTSCDRTAHRFRVLDATPVLRWGPAVREYGLQPVRHQLEQAPRALPAHWWVARRPVPVAYDPEPTR